MRHTALLLITLLLPVSSIHAQDTTYRSDPKFQKAWKDALGKNFGVSSTVENPNLTFMRGRAPSYALKDFQKANEIAGGKCAECLEMIMHMQQASFRMDDVIRTANELLLLYTRPQDIGRIQEARGEATLINATALPWSSFSRKKDPDTVRKQEEMAHTDFQAAMLNDPKNLMSWFLDGRALALLGRDEEAKTDFHYYVEHAPEEDNHHVAAERYADNPTLAGKPFINGQWLPPFNITTTDGQTFTPDNLKGKVVVLEFWTSWCPACAEDVPIIRKIVKDYAGERFQLIGVSIDGSKEHWINFVMKHELTWPQYRDDDHHMRNVFAVIGIPVYFIFDAQGRRSGYIFGDDGLDRRLRTAIDKAMAAQPILPAQTAAK